MRHIALQGARLVLYATLAHCALACGADTDHGPPIGSPPGPTGPVVNDGGRFDGGGQGGANQNTGGGNPGVTPGITGGTLGAAGNDSIGIGGSGVAGGDPFGVGGAATGGSNPFGIAGTPSAFSGTSSF